MPSQPDKTAEKKQDVKFPTRPQQGLFKPIITTPEKGSRQQRKRLFK